MGTTLSERRRYVSSIGIWTDVQALFCDEDTDGFDIDPQIDLYHDMVEAELREIYPNAWISFTIGARVNRIEIGIKEAEEDNPSLRAEDDPGQHADVERWVSAITQDVWEQWIVDSPFPAWKNQIVGAATIE